MIAAWTAFQPSRGEAVATADPDVAEEYELGDDIAWGFRELLDRSNDPVERRRLLAEYQALNSELFERHRELSKAAAERRGAAHPVSRQSPTLDALTPEETELAILRERILRTFQETTAAASTPDGRRTAAAEARLQLHADFERERMLKQQIDNLRPPAQEGNPDELQSEPLVVGSDEEIEMRAIRKRAAENVRHIRESTIDPVSRRQALSEHGRLHGAELDEARALSLIVNRQIAQHAISTAPSADDSPEELSKPD